MGKFVKGDVVVVPYIAPPSCRRIKPERSSPESSKLSARRRERGRIPVSRMLPGPGDQSRGLAVGSSRWRNCCS